MSEELKNCKTSNDASIQLTKNFLDKISFKGPQQAIETSYQNIENVFRINRNNDIASFFLDEKIVLITPQRFHFVVFTFSLELLFE